jgi:hypothetical protein
LVTTILGEVDTEYRFLKLSKFQNLMDMMTKTPEAAAMEMKPDNIANARPMDSA